ncbi:MAG: hypothetical protein H0U52_01670 [Chloroflexi bacterium]|nr:hypothetical protein [Chloroflexota bacterium]
MANAPIRLRVRMYQVGFGDCFLLTFEYAAPLADGRAVRHMLIDFGTTSLPGWDSLATPARWIKQHTAGEIDVVVVSHRHRDHLSAFGQKSLMNGFFAVGYPRLVVRSWTEDPDLDSNAVGPASRLLLRTIGAAQRFSAALAGQMGLPPARSLAADVRQVADDQLSDPAAVVALAGWARGRGRYLFYGVRSGIESFIPGLRVKVLGPPTVEQHPEVAKQRSRDPEEFWMFYRNLVEKLPAAAVDEAERADAVPDASLAESPDAGDDRLPPALDAPSPARAFGDPGPVRWLTDRMSRQQLGSLLRIAHLLDDVLNNTSLILLFELDTGAGPIRLLFPGDAQIENWDYALKVARAKVPNRRLLRSVDLYKVGHHGSRNATPRTLYNLWTEPVSINRPLVALMSTKPGVHGKTEATRVPRRTLVAALDTRTREHLFSTEGITAAEPFVELVADLNQGRAFQTVTIGSRRKGFAIDGPAEDIGEPPVDDD